MTRFISSRNLRFLISEVFDAGALTSHPCYDRHTPGMFHMVIDEAVTLATQLMYPLLSDMDRHPPVLENGRVTVHRSVKKIMAEFGNGGWIASGFPESHGGEQLPFIIRSAASFVFAASNYSAAAYPELTAGAAELITSFGSRHLIDTYVPPMLAGRWQGTMALTEPQAGSSLSDITTTAFRDDNGRFRIKGVKTFISAGDHDGVENVVHLMLARIENAPPGARGISLFVVPKKRRDDQGNLVSNDVTTASIYHKLGYRGTPAAELSMGEKDNCFGWLVGEENKGLAHMFQMMNEARILVGLASCAIASAAYHAALEYARKRPQGRPVTRKDPLTAQVPIIAHADVKRMLLFQRGVIEGGLGLILQCALYADLIRVSHGEEKERYQLLLDLLTPVAKAFPSEYGFMAVSSAIQCFGGYGYCEDFPVEQYLRDIRIQAIHEGTTGIQGMDLLGRKLVMKNGRAGILFLAELDHAIQAAKPLPGLAHAVQALADAGKLLETVAGARLNIAGQGNIDAFLADATLFLEFFSLIAIAWQWLIQGIAAEKALAGNPSRKEKRFYQGKRFAMQYFFRYELPKIHGLSVRLLDGDHLTLDMDPEYLTDY